MTVISVNNISKDYGNNKGVFDLSFEVNKGEIVGFLGPNGAGKTTTIRQIMGFIKPDNGSVLINGLDCFSHADKISQNLGYLPGEIAFMDDMTGIEFIKFIAGMKNISDLTRANELIHMFELDPKGKIKKMSKGTKQKIGIVCAFMGNADIYILDEPTSGLDPLMQGKFTKLLNDEAMRGATILMSSHIFEEIEKTCQRTIIIKDGKLVSNENTDTLKSKKSKSYEISFEDIESLNKFATAYPNSLINNLVATVTVTGSAKKLIQDISSLNVHDITTHTQTLEELFMHYYGGDNND